MGSWDVATEWGKASGPTRRELETDGRTRPGILRYATVRSMDNEWDGKVEMILKVR